jgi:D-glycero-alpha-D-manno-heptose-7-phosphate kinase
MILSRTPFRVTLGGGGTDLPSYYEKYGGFIFSFGISKYMYVSVNSPAVDDYIRLKYSKSEKVLDYKKLDHEIARACLEKANIFSKIEISSIADIPAGSGLGSSSVYTVGLLNALFSHKKEYLSLKELAEMACEIEMDILKKPMGKQDQYLAAFSGFTVMEIDKSGEVTNYQLDLSPSLIKDLNRNIMIFYTGKQRLNKGILSEQDKSTKNKKKSVLDSLHYIKDSGYKILEIVKSENIDQLGEMFDEHWQHKKKLSSGVSNKRFDDIYSIAKANGALGGKISGAGGGGFFTFYCNEKHQQLRKAMISEGLIELNYNFDFDGSKIVSNHS